MAKSVTTIPATLSRFTAAPINSTKKRRVAAYARVSTDNEEQLTSYEAQVDYYTNYIQGRDDWGPRREDRPDHHKVGQPFCQKHS